MSFGFEQHHGIILVKAILRGPSRDGFLLLALDTGATKTVISESVLKRLGYQIEADAKRIELTTVSGIEYVPRVLVRSLSALGRERDALRVVCHSVPEKADIDGLLGLDFMRGLQLMIDFREGVITLQ